MSTNRVMRGGAKEKRKAALDNLKKARASVGTRTELHDLKEEDDVYDLVDEADYEKLVEERRKADDFVVDDEGLGYLDDGEEHLGAEEEANGVKRLAEDEDEDGESRTVKKARRLNKAASAGPIQKNTMFNFVRTGQSSLPKSSMASEPQVEDVLDLDSLLSDLKAPLTNSSNRKSLSNMNSSKPPLRPSRGSTIHQIRSVPQEIEDDAAIHVSSMPAMVSDHFQYEGETTSYYEDDNDDDNNGRTEPMQEEGKGTPSNHGSTSTITSETVKDTETLNSTTVASQMVEESQKISLTKTNRKLKPVPAPVPVAPVVDVNALPDLGKAGNMGLADIGEGSVPVSDGQNAIDPSWWLHKSEPMIVDGAEGVSAKSTHGKPITEYVTMFWIDATEVNGVVYLFGRVPVSEPGGAKRFVSCCVAVHGHDRNLFVLPKATGEISSDGTAVRTNLTAVHKDLRKMLVPDILPLVEGQSFRCKPVKRSYAFEYGDIPRNEQQYLKVVYPAKFSTPNASQCAGKGYPSIERIFGAGSSALELFLLKRKLMGPCWIIINNPRTMPDPTSWCTLEIGVENPKLIVKMSANDTPPVPPLVTMSISMKTAVNPTTHVHEIVCISALVHTKVDLEGDTDVTPTLMRRFTFVRQLGTSCGSAYPNCFPHDLEAESHKAAGNSMKTFPNERALLSLFFQKFQLEDPDILVSHNLFGFEFDVLLARAIANKLPLWSKVGRLRRSKVPKGISDKDVAAGRLLCDTYKAAKEFLRETTYSLTHLAQSQLKYDRIEVDPVDVPRYFGSSADIIKLANHCACDAMLIQRLMLKLQIIPLTKQLTNLSGNLWARTMRGARAERIEYLLLHEFYQLKYILPEKKAYENNKKGFSSGKGREAMEEDDDDDAKVGGVARNKAKAAYAGGLVLEPKKGLYDTFILLLDFNSLYPSLIQEYNLCFTTIQWTKYMPSETSSTTTKKSDKTKVKFKSETKKTTIEGDEEEEDEEVEEVAEVEVIPENEEEGEKDSSKTLPPLPELTQSPGVLPRVIRNLVERRKGVKSLLKKERDPSLRQQLDIRQKALKLTANSMYGCLGFTFSRFYARPIAALVTAKGREALQRTVELATNQLGLEVIYGDTDSVMINTGSVDLEKVKEMGNQVRKEVNKLYKCLELDIDGVFKSMLLLKKKKYAALSIKELDGTLSYEKEMKGLDLVRRDWCPLSKDTGRYVVDQILSGKSREEIVYDIHEYLSTLATKVRNDKDELDCFIITKGLNKSPKDYPDCKGQPHLQVALQMLKQNKPVNIGDHIPYVICAEGEEGAAPAQRAHHPDEIRRSNGQLTVDVEWYLLNQLLPPISRLCEPIEGTSPAILATQLGLDASRFSNRASSSSEFQDDGWGFTPRSRMSDEERFRGCQPLLITCISCKVETAFPKALIGHDNIKSSNSMSCTNCGSMYWGRSKGADLYCYLSNRVTLLVRRCVSKYYDCWLVCDDHSCGRRTMQQSVLGLTCTENCHGRMIQEYDEATLHTQLKYLESLFDEKKEITQERDSKTTQSKETILTLVKKHMEHVVESNAYNWIRPSLWTIHSQIRKTAVA